MKLLRRDRAPHPRIAQSDEERLEMVEERLNLVEEKIKALEAVKREARMDAGHR